MKKEMFLLVIVILSLISIVNLSSGLVIDSVSMVPNEIAPGENAMIKIEIENNGDKDIEDIGVSLDLNEIPFAPYNSATDYNIDEIEEGDDETAKFNIVALNDAKSGIYKIPVTISYNEEDEEIVKESLISITVNSKPILSVNAENDYLLKEQESEVSIEVTNKGLSDVRFLEVEIQDSIYSKIIGSKSSYLGDLDSDDFESEEFKIYFKKNTPDVTNLNVIVRYKDAINNQYIEEFEVLLNVYSKEEAIELGLVKRNNVFLYIFIAIVLIIVYFVYKKIKNIRKKKKLEDSE